MTTKLGPAAEYRRASSAVPTTFSTTIAFSPSEVSIYYSIRAPRIKQTQGDNWRGGCPIHEGNGANFAVHSNTGKWFCHSRCGRGGDILSLEQQLTRVDFRAAKSEVFRLLGRAEPHNNLSRHELRTMARSRVTAEQTAIAERYWLTGRVAQLERKKAVAIEREDIGSLAEASSELHVLKTDKIMAERLYGLYSQRDPRGTAGLIKWAREDEKQAQQIAAMVVLMLPRAKDSHE